MSFLKAESKKDLLIHLGIIITVTVLLIVLFFYVYLPITTNHGELIKVPDLKGQSVVDADKTLSDLSLRYQINDSSYIPGEKPFTVITQHPLANSEVKANRKIYITVTAKNPPLVPMPDLNEKSLKAAEMELKSRDLVLGTVKLVPYHFSNIVLSQKIAGQLVEPKTHIPKGSIVDLEVGDGQKIDEIEIPNLVGLSLDEARAQLSSLGLEEGLVKKEQVSGKNPNEVIRQSPEYKMGATIRTGESINFWYAE